MGSREREAKAEGGSGAKDLTTSLLQVERSLVDCLVVRRMEEGEIMVVGRKYQK